LAQGQKLQRPKHGKQAQFRDPHTQKS